MYFLEKEASKNGTDPAALEPVTESRKEGSVQEFGRGRFFLIVFGVINVRQWWENGDDGSGGADPNNYKDTKMTGYWKWDTPYPQLGTQRVLFMQEEYWYSPIMWQSWHTDLQTKLNENKKKPLDQETCQRWRKAALQERKRTATLRDGAPRNRLTALRRLRLSWEVGWSMDRRNGRERSQICTHTGKRKKTFYRWREIVVRKICKMCHTIRCRKKRIVCTQCLRDMELRMILKNLLF